MSELTRLEQELGIGYQQVILDHLGKDCIIEYGYSPTWWITCDKDINWKGKSYWVRKALNQMKKNGLVESFKHGGGVGWCWALTGKMREW